MDMRKEKDLLGEMEIPADALYGIHTARAMENFPLALRPVHKKLISAFGAVKLACAKTNHELKSWDDKKYSAIQQACNEMIAGKLDDHIKVDALQGGAGTSTNMNVNEVLANRALVILGKKPGDYDIISPIDDINLHQSTNDTYPTALKVAALWELAELEKEIVVLLEYFQQKEKQFADIVKLGRTQLQDAVLTTLGRQMSAYAEAIGRDRWRIYKCGERLRVVNLGGTAIGTGLGAPRKYIFRVVEHLNEITKLPVCRAENLIDATQNTDVFVEVSGILKALASNLLKISTDLRILSSGPDGGIGEIALPARQAGSSIMPGKVNPVIPEAVSQAAIAVMANDLAITQACSAGNLELNQFMPLIADAMLTNIQLLTNACRIFGSFCVSGIEANEKRCKQNIETSTAIVTSLVEKIGYKTAQEVAAAAKKENKTIRQIVLQRKIMNETEFDSLISPQKVTMLGSADTTEKK
jgi:aspartate ammonia-lyase